MSDPLVDIIELGQPRLSHITAEGEEVVKPTLTPEEHHLRVLAQLPLADLLSEDLEDPTPAPAAPAAPAASAAAGPPPPEVMHRLKAAQAEADMVSMLVRAMLTGKQLRPGQVQREAGATRRAGPPASERAFLKQRQLATAATELRGAAARLRERLARERRVLAQARRLRSHWQLLEMTPGQPSQHAADAAALPSLRLHLGAASAAAAAVLGGSSSVAAAKGAEVSQLQLKPDATLSRLQVVAAADGGVVRLSPTEAGTLAVAAARAGGAAAAQAGPKAGLQVVVVQAGGWARASQPWRDRLGAAVGAGAAGEAREAGGAGGGSGGAGGAEDMEVEAGGIGGAVAGESGAAGVEEAEAEAALRGLHASLLDAQFSRRSRATFDALAAAASGVAATDASFGREGALTAEARTRAFRANGHSTLAR